MVTGMVTLWPGSTTYGLNPAVASVAVFHRSPVGELTIWSHPSVTAVILVEAVTSLNPFEPSGPLRNGVIDQSPSATGAWEKEALAVVPVVEMTCGSPSSPS